MFAGLGVFILWLGWFGFNPGSQLAIVGKGNTDAVMLIAVNTLLAAGAGRPFPAEVGVGDLDVGFTKEHTDVGGSKRVLTMPSRRSAAQRVLGIHPGIAHGTGPDGDAQPLEGGTPVRVRARPASDYGPRLARSRDEGEIVLEFSLADEREGKEREE